MLLIIAQPRTQPQPPLSLTNVQLFGGTLYYTMVLYSLSLSLLSTLSHAIVIYSPGQQKEMIYSAPIRDIELKFWG